MGKAVTVDPHLRLAIEEARKSLAQGGIPIGSVLVKDGRVVAKGHNRWVQDNDPMAHAEICCLRDGGRMSSYHGAVLYSTLMPCYLCAGAGCPVRIEIPGVGTGPLGRVLQKEVLLERLVSKRQFYICIDAAILEQLLHGL